MTLKWLVCYIRNKNLKVSFTGSKRGSGKRTSGEELWDRLCWTNSQRKISFVAANISKLKLSLRLVHRFLWHSKRISSLKHSKWALTRMIQINHINRKCPQRLIR
jgi:hypothetical protein